MSEPLSDDAITMALASLPGWSHQDEALEKTFTFVHFRDAICFIVRISYEADAMDHHPEIYNVYNKVCIRLQTHDAGSKVTERDEKLAERIEELASA